MVVVWPHCNSLSLACCSARSVATLLNLPARFDAGEGNGGERVARPPGGGSAALFAHSSAFSFPMTSYVLEPTGCSL